MQDEGRRFSYVHLTVQAEVAEVFSVWNLFLFIPEVCRIVASLPWHSFCFKLGKLWLLFSPYRREWNFTHCLLLWNIFLQIFHSVHLLSENVQNSIAVPLRNNPKCSQHYERKMQECAYVIKHSIISTLHTVNTSVFVPLKQAHLHVRT